MEYFKITSLLCPLKLRAALMFFHKATKLSLAKKGDTVKKAARVKSSRQFVVEYKSSHYEFSYFIDKAEYVKPHDEHSGLRHCFRLLNMFSYVQLM